MNETRDGYDPELFGLLEDLEARSFWFEARARLVDWSLMRFFPGATSLAEIGCGTGFMLQGLCRAHPALDLTGVELFAEGLDVARSRVPAARLVEADARDLPFEDEFDVVATLDVLEHIREDEAVLGQIRSALRPGGGLIITVPQHPWLWSPADDAFHHERRYTRRDLVAKLRAAGFDPLRVTSFVSLPLPAMVAARIAARRRKHEYSLRDELEAAERGGRALRGLMTLERALIRAGVSFSAGGSLLVVARSSA